MSRFNLPALVGRRCFGRCRRDSVISECNREFATARYRYIDIIRCFTADIGQSNRFGSQNVVSELLTCKARHCHAQGSRRIGESLTFFGHHQLRRFASEGGRGRFGAHEDGGSGRETGDFCLVADIGPILAAIGAVFHGGVDTGDFAVIAGAVGGRYNSETGGRVGTGRHVIGEFFTALDQREGLSRIDRGGLAFGGREIKRCQSVIPVIEGIAAGDCRQFFLVEVDGYHTVFGNGFVFFRVGDLFGSEWCRRSGFRCRAGIRCLGS